MGHGATRSLVLAGVLAAAAAGAADAPTDVAPDAAPDFEFLEFLGGAPAGDAAAGDWDLILDALGGAAAAGPAPPAQPAAGADGSDDAPPR